MLLWKTCIRVYTYGYVIRDLTRSPTPKRNYSYTNHYPQTCHTRFASRLSVNSCSLRERFAVGLQVPPPPLLQHFDRIFSLTFWAVPGSPCCGTYDRTNILQTECVDFYGSVSQKGKTETLKDRFFSYYNLNVRTGNRTRYLPPL